MTEKEGGSSSLFPAIVGEIKERGAPPEPATGRFKGPMYSMGSLLQYSGRKGGPLRGPTEYRWKTPTSRLWKGNHRAYRSYRKEARGPLHAWVQDILYRYDWL